MVTMWSMIAFVLVAVCAPSWAASTSSPPSAAAADLSSDTPPPPQPIAADAVAEACANLRVDDDDAVVITATSIREQFRTFFKSLDLTASDFIKSGDGLYRALGRDPDLSVAFRDFNADEIMDVYNRAVVWRKSDAYTLLERIFRDIDQPELRRLLDGLALVHVPDADKTAAMMRERIRDGRLPASLDKIPEERIGEPMPFLGYIVKLPPDERTVLAEVGVIRTLLDCGMFFPFFAFVVQVLQETTPTATVMEILPFIDHLYPPYMYGVALYTLQALYKQKRLDLLEAMVRLKEVRFDIRAHPHGLFYACRDYAGIFEIVFRVDRDLISDIINVKFPLLPLWEDYTPWWEPWQYGSFLHHGVGRNADLLKLVLSVPGLDTSLRVDCRYAIGIDGMTGPVADCSAVSVLNSKSIRYVLRTVPIDLLSLLILSDPPGFLEKVVEFQYIPREPFADVRKMAEESPGAFVDLIGAVIRDNDFAKIGPELPIVKLSSEERMRRVKDREERVKLVEEEWRRKRDERLQSVQSQSNPPNS